MTTGPTLPIAADPPMLRIATRGSTLALIQAGMVRDALAGIGHMTQLVVVETAGDRRAPDTPWGEGAFVAAIEHALVDGRADIAVHSAKDVPVDGDARLAIAAYLPREDPRDALVVRDGVVGDSPLTLPQAAVVGTDSPRRGAFLRAIRPDLHIRSIHGNVDTRLRRLDAGEADVLVLAVAGLVRLGRRDRIAAILDPREMPPAPGQGAIAIQVRATDARARTAVAPLDDAPTRRAVEMERAFLDVCGGGCRAPVGALATETDGRTTMVGGVADGSGRAVIDTIASRLAVVETTDGDTVSTLAASLVDRLAPESAPRVGVTRPASQATPLARELAMRGLGAARMPAIAIEIDDPAATARALAALPPGSWVVVTSANGARAIPEARGDLRWAAVGTATATALTRAGALDVWTPGRTDAMALADGLPIDRGVTCLLVRGDLADAALPEALGARGTQVREVVAYRTVVAPPASRRLVADAIARGLVALTFASGSAARGLVALAEHARADLRSLPALCIGPATATAASAAGFATVLTATTPTDAALADLAAMTLAVPA